MEEPAAEPEPVKAEEPAAADIVTVEGDVTTVALEGNDLMQFNAKMIEVPAGKTVKVVLQHTGKQAAATMGHNFVLLKSGVDYKAFGAASATAKDNGYIPPAMAGDVIAHTELVGGAEGDTKETSIEFPAPEVGEYPFLCSFPGHFGTMNGTFKVVPAE